MGPSTEELNTEIVETRQSMAANVDALQDRVSPAAIVERRKEAARGRVRSARDKVMGSAGSLSSSATGGAGSVNDSAHDAVSGTQDKIQGSPLAAGLVAFGAGLVVAALIPASEKEAVAAGHVVDIAKDKGQPLVDQAKSVGQDVAASVGESAGAAVQEVKDAATEGADRVRSEGQAGADEVRTQAQS